MSELGPAENIRCPDDDSDEVTKDEYEDDPEKMSQQLKHWRRKRGGAGGCSPPERWTQGAAPLTNWCQWVSETKCEIKQPVVGPQWYGTEAHRVFLRPGYAANSNCSTR